MHTVAKKITRHTKQPINYKRNIQNATDTATVETQNIPQKQL